MKKIGLVTIIAIILFATIGNVKAQTENMQTFFDYGLPGVGTKRGMKIVVNATLETQPNKNVTVSLGMHPLPEVEVTIQSFNFSIFGFINGTFKIMMFNVSDNNAFPLNASQLYTFNFTVPEQVWGVTYGEITLTYNAKSEGITIEIPCLVVSFPMTHIKNVYLETVEEQLENLSSILEQINQTFRQYSGKDLTPENLNETLQKLQGNQNELSSTRMAVAVLTITTVFFIATTAYLFLRKPREYW